MLSLDTRSREPIYVQIEKEIVKYINLGIFEPNSALPSVRALACELGINPNTVSKAYRNLEQHGVVYTIVGKGVFVGGSDLNGFRQEALEAVKKVLSDAKNSGVKKSEISSIINNVWEDNPND